jgi:sec-independent protein translocase protein TatA
MGDLFTAPHLIFLGILAVLLFGGKKLPELGKGLGEGLRGFKDGMKGISDPEPTKPTQSTAAPIESSHTVTPPAPGTDLKPPTA